MFTTPRLVSRWSRLCLLQTSDQANHCSHPCFASRALASRWPRWANRAQITTLDVVRADKFVHEMTGAPMSDVSVPVIGSSAVVRRPGRRSSERRGRSEGKRREARLDGWRPPWLLGSPFSANIWVKALEGQGAWASWASRTLLRVFKQSQTCAFW